MLRISYIISILLLFCSTGHAQENLKKTPVKKYQGLLWEITGNGLEKPSYLYGTMHVSKKVAFHLSDTFFIALKNVERIALESDPSTWMEQLEDLSSLGAKLSRFGGGISYKGFYRDAFETYPPTNKALAILLRKDHRQLNGMLHRISFTGENFEEQTYLDLFIYQTGKRDGKDVVALEEYKETMRLLAKAIIPDDKPKPRVNIIDLFKDGRTATEITEDAYRKGDLDLIDSITVLTSRSDNFHKYFIIERNKIMADGMDSLLKTASLFTGVGAAHLPGKEGVINLLRQKGYTLRAVNPKAGRSSTKMKKKIENTVVPLQLSIQYPPDSSFSVMMPGKLYESPFNGGDITYFYPEMVNGSYFSVNRVSTYSAITGKPMAFLQSRLDSLLFENIPGDIEHKTIIQKNGYPGFDILNRTRRGDYQRYQIIITPLEIFVFKAGGVKKYVSAGDVNKFFNSITIYTPKNGTSKYTALSGQVSANMYNYRIGFSEKKSSSDPNQFTHTQAYDKKTGAYQLLIGASLNDFEYIEEDSFELEQIVIELGEEFNLKVEDQRFGLHKHYPTVWATLKSEEKKMDVMVIIKGSRYFMALNIGADPEPFFSSIDFVDARYKEEFVEYTDTLLLFTVKTVPQPDDDDLGSMIIRYASHYSTKASGTKIDNSHHSKHLNKIIRCNETNEEIQIDYNTYHKYYGRTDSLFWSYREDNLIDEDDDLYIKTRSETRSDSLIIRDYLICDSTSTRAIMAKHILRGGLLHTLRTSVDTLSSPSAFVTSFFETFTPKEDTIIDHDVFQSKALAILRDLRSDDSLTKKLAKRSVGRVYIDFYDDRAALAEFIKTYEFGSKDLKLKGYFIEDLGEVDDDTMPKELERIYVSSGGKTTVELACLEALSDRYDQKSYQGLLRIIKSGNLPIPGYDNELNSLFRNLNDSIELSKVLFPALFDFISYPEYKVKVFTLLAELVHEGLVSKNIYGNQKNRIIRESQNELKRQLSGEESMDEIKFDAYVPGSFDYGLYEYRYDSYGSTISESINGFSKLMLPLYDESQVKEYFHKLMTSQQGMLLLTTAGLLLEKGRPVNDTLWTFFCKKEESRVASYIMLEELERLDLFDSTYLSQEMFIRSQLFGGYTEEKDTIIFLEKQKVKHLGEEGYVYFFKRKPKEKEYWRFEYIGLQPLDTTTVEAENIIERSSTKINVGDDIDELIEEAVRKLNLTGRKRVDFYSRSLYGFGDYFGY